MIHRCDQLLLVLVLVSTIAAADDTPELRLVPFPKEVRRLAGRFSVVRPLLLEASEGQVEVFARSLNNELERAGFKPIQVRAMRSPALAWRLTVGGSPGELPDLPAGENPEGYALELRSDEVVCAAREEAGLTMASKRCVN